MNDKDGGLGYTDWLLTSSSHVGIMDQCLNSKERKFVTLQDVILPIEPLASQVADAAASHQNLHLHLGGKRWIDVKSKKAGAKISSQQGGGDGRR